VNESSKLKKELPLEIIQEAEKNSGWRCGDEECKSWNNNVKSRFCGMCSAPRMDGQASKIEFEQKTLSLRATFVKMEQLLKDAKTTILDLKAKIGNKIYVLGELKKDACVHIAVSSVNFVSAATQFLTLGQYLTNTSKLYAGCTMVMPLITSVTNYSQYKEADDLHKVLQEQLTQINALENKYNDIVRNMEQQMREIGLKKSLD